jgi:hypothetical protein
MLPADLPQQFRVTDGVSLKRVHERALEPAVPMRGEGYFSEKKLSTGGE